MVKGLFLSYVLLEDLDFLSLKGLQVGPSILEMHLFRTPGVEGPSSHGMPKQPNPGPSAPNPQSHCRIWSSS